MITTQSGVQISLAHEIDKAKRIREGVKETLDKFVFTHGGAVRLREELISLNGLIDDLERIQGDNL